VKNDTSEKYDNTNPDLGKFPDFCYDDSEGIIVDSAGGGLLVIRILD
jgi:hypothetical protein